ncbi:MAG: adenosine kinase [Candidatus Marinimicrobia bacterium]|jgi:sugar/nucleoside kinase (ribokinase family)|nr:adenosine kinase [Candidatus Neomarinimicrobiota bacterium]MBT3937968.1 adenosine kinase [Candidatus Neomarinimicrobiota bacterium]MBT3962226.1 adenosine kinase [Candidatus Neomarinimicrobiota bacterium]MBT4383799.1 adenosine kinase [Candidatus Neomarinimicrobiota bacterium]MBT4636909.1 adenosine kinase [Candidatus Neomarinimicrobiota bacterium]
MLQTPKIYGIGNPLIDIVISVQDDDLTQLGIDKGIMHLVDENRQDEILSYLKNSKSIYHPGGSAPNTMLACAGLGIPSLIAGKIGQDNFSDIYIKQADEYGVISGLVRGDGPTGSSIILVTPDGERTMNTHLGMCREYSATDVDQDLLSKSKYLYFTGYMWDTDAQKGAVTLAMDIAKENGITIVFDVADPFAVDRNKDEFLAMIGNDVNVVFANQSECAILFETDDYNASTNQLLPMINQAGIKLGKKGSVVLDRGEKSMIPSSPILATDSTGAGDMYAAGFLASISNGYPIIKAGEIAGFLAEEIIQIPGAQFDVEKIQSFKTKYFS